MLHASWCDIRVINVSVHSIALGEQTRPRTMPSSRSLTCQVLPESVLYRGRCQRGHCHSFNVFQPIRRDPSVTQSKPAAENEQIFRQSQTHNQNDIMADSRTEANPPIAPTVPVSALDRKRPDDQATAAVVAANQRATTLDSVKSPAELTVFVSCLGNQLAIPTLTRR